MSQSLGVEHLLNIFFPAREQSDSPLFHSWAGLSDRGEPAKVLEELTQNRMPVHPDEPSTPN